MNYFKPYIIIFIFIEILIIPIILRIYGMGFLIVPNEETRLYLITQIICHDSIIYTILISLIYFSYLTFVPKILSFILRIFALFFFILYITDIFILKNFVTHININDVNKYLSYVPKYIEQEYNMNILHIFLLSALLIIFIYFVKESIKISKVGHYVIISIICILLFVNSFTKDTYVHSWVYKNFIEYNIDLLKKSKDYSEEMKKNISNEDHNVCETKISEKRNIVILMIESFASYQSNYFSGIKNWTPSLDKIAKSNISIKDFNSNGFVTEDGEISILTGLYPIYSPKLKEILGSTAFQGFYSVKNSLPNILNKRNYSTEFVTSSDLTFSNTEAWAKSLGFDYIEGSEHPFYENKKRYHFQAPADEYLFKRVLDRIEIKKEDNPYFIFVKTVSSHIPFLNPETENYSEEETIRYVDKQIGLFYKKLQKKNFFKNGILIITGDHHPIIPLKKEQIEKYGVDLAGTRVPLVASFGESIQKKIKGNFQQVDIYNSVKNYVSNSKCTSQWSGDFLTEKPINPSFNIYRRGDRRGDITVFNKDNTYNVRLNGDDTKVTNHNKSNITEDIVNKINYERIQRQKNESRD